MASKKHLNSAQKPWSAEYAMTGAFASALIQQQFPELGPLNIEFLGAGWDNTVFQVNTNYVFRFPRRAVAVPLLQQECLTLKSLERTAPKFALAHPIPRFQGRPGTVETEHYPWPFMGYTRVTGQTACQARVPESKRKDWAAILGQTLKQLHHHPVPPTLLGDTLKRADLRHRLPWFQEQWKQTLTLAEQQGERFPQGQIETFLHQLEHIERSSPPEEDRALLHGDLYIRHLIVDSHQRLSGLIDWGDTHHGDISTDLGILYSAIPPKYHHLFWQNYGPVSELTRYKACFRALYSSCYIYRYGIDIQDTDLQREGRQGIQWIASSSH